MIQKTQYRTCQCESAQKVERQVLVIRGLKKRLSRNVRANIVASKQITRLEAENNSLKKKIVELENGYKRSENRLDANWDSYPRIEVTE